jgi:hypothetical protein
MRKWLFASFILYYFISSEDSKIWEVARKLPGSRQEVARKSRTSEVVSIVTGLVVGYLVSSISPPEAFCCRSRKTPPFCEHSGRRDSIAISIELYLDAMKGKGRTQTKGKYSDRII